MKVTATRVALAIAAVMACAVISIGGASAKPPVGTVICANCDNGNYPPPVACSRDTGDFAIGWQGSTWFCFGGVWIYGGRT